MSPPSSSSSPCTAPLSWLRLERYHLGEAASDREAIAAHLDACSYCAAHFARIVEDDTRALPPLQEPPVRVVPAWFARPRTLALAGGLVLAAAVLLSVGRGPVDPEPGARMKGDGLSFALVREDEALIAEAGGSYRDGERFKAVLTCSPGAHGSFDVAVFERSGVSFPLAQSSGLSCGNSVALPGAFRVTGHERMTVCLVWQPEGPIDREVIRQTPPDLLPRAICKTLEPALGNGP